MKLATFFLLLAFAVTLQAATLTVNSTADAGAGSLRDQLAAAANGDTVDVTVTGTITLTGGEILITGKNLTLTGPGAKSLTVTTNGSARALHFVNSQCTISGFTFDNCKALAGDVDTGGAVVVDNFSSGGETNVVTISDCTFSNNQSGWGGAVDVFRGGLAMTRCTFSGNSSTGSAFGTDGGGGALSIGPSLDSTITNSTFSGNIQNGAATGQPGGGAIYNYGAGPGTPPTVTVEHCTFAGNIDAAGAAGAIRENFTASYHTVANLRNCLFVSNQAPVSALKNFAGSATGPLTTSFTSLGGNVTDESVSSGQFMWTTGDKTNNSAVAGSLSPVLALNGGSTATYAITRGSPAQRNCPLSSVATDQRGAPRHGAADAGAYELIEPEMSVTVSSAAVPENGSLAFGSTPFDAPVTKTITITNTQTSAFATGQLQLSNLVLPVGYSASGFPGGSLGNGQSASFTVTLLSSDAGIYDAPMTFSGNDSFSPALATGAAGLPNLHSFNLSGLITDTIDHWREVYFGPGSTNSGPASDLATPAGDSITNLEKYALGLDPFVSYATTPGITVDFTPGGQLRMTVVRNPAATDVGMALETSGDLVSWSSSEMIVDQDSTDIYQAHDVPMNLNAASRFIRLRFNRE